MNSRILSDSVGVKNQLEKSQLLIVNLRAYLRFWISSFSTVNTAFCPVWPCWPATPVSDRHRLDTFEIRVRNLTLTFDLSVPSTPSWFLRTTALDIFCSGHHFLSWQTVNFAFRFMRPVAQFSDSLYTVPIIQTKKGFFWASVRLWTS